VRLASGATVNSDLIKGEAAVLTLRQTALIMAGRLETPALAAERAKEPAPFCPHCQAPDDQRHRLRPCRTGSEGAETRRVRRRGKGPPTQAEKVFRWQQEFPMGRRLLAPRRQGFLHLERGDHEDPR
jgi:hypothetical protein